MVKIQRMRRENTKSDTSDGSETNSDMIGVFDDVISGSEGQNQAQNEKIVLFRPQSRHCHHFLLLQL